MKVVTKQMSPSTLYYTPNFQPAARPVNTRERIQREIQWIRWLMMSLLHITLVTAFSSFLFAASSGGPLLYLSALLSSMASICIIIAEKQISKCECWMELCIMTLCSLYAPFFVLLASFVILLGHITSHS